MQTRIFAAAPNRRNLFMRDTHMQIEELKTAKAEFLSGLWTKTFRKTYPSQLPRALIVQLLAYRLQANRYGDLNAEESKYLAKAAGNGPIARFGEERRPRLPGPPGSHPHRPG
jgi:hypothetical protein